VSDQITDPKAIRAALLKEIQRTLTSARSDNLSSQMINIKFGRAAGVITVAQKIGAITFQESNRLDELLLNASNRAAEDLSRIERASRHAA